MPLSYPFTFAAFETVLIAALERCMSAFGPKADAVIARSDQSISDRLCLSNPFLEMTRERVGILGRFIGTNNLGCSLRGSFAVLDYRTA